MELHEFLLQLRKKNSLSQAELAEKLGITRQTISRWEAGLAMPSAENLIGLSRVYGIPAEELLGGDAVLDAEDASSDAKHPTEASCVHMENTEKRRSGGKRFLAVIAAACLLISLWGIFCHALPAAVLMLLSIGNIALVALIVYSLVNIIKSA